MPELTVGFVSGIIAAGVFVSRILIPHVISLIVVGQLPDENSIVSWSVVSRLIQSSSWPMLLRTDTAASTGVGRRIEIYTWLQFIALVLVAIAGIVTPLGLYDTVMPQDIPTLTAFHYVRDTSAFGKATPPRDGYRSIRMCYTDGISNTSLNGCPGAPANLTQTNDDITENFSVWPNRINLFTSGDVPPTVASLFDIQWRSFRVSRQPSGSYGPLGNEFSEGYYRQISQLILEDDLLAVEGLIVDTKTGRVGFRNHTVPVDALEGAEWMEDILFIEPETRCVNTNLTLDYKYQTNDTGSDEFVDRELVDHGGFTNLSHDRPTLDPGNFQVNPALQDRAYRAAWSHNMFLMQYFNITTNGSDGSVPFAYMNSNVGKRFPLKFNRGEFGVSLSTSTIQTSTDYGAVITGSNLSIAATTGPNPFNVTGNDAFQIGREACQYPSYFARSNMSFVAAECGLVFAAPQRTDGGNALFPDANSRWSTPIYSCAAGTKAAIREVKFHYNGTGGLEKLVIQSINEKAYSNPSEMPLWGVERNQNYTLYNVRPLWGIVSPETITGDDISVVQRDHLWLPGFPDIVSLEPVIANGEPNMPGNLFYARALQDLFRIQLGGLSPEALMAYTGKLDLALYARWLELSASSTGTEKLLNQVWTDLAANSVIGTRGWHSGPRPSLRWNGVPERDKTIPTPSVPVVLWSRRIRYHIQYAVPAFITLGIIVALIGLTVFLLVSRRTGLRQLRRYLAITSPGRILGLSQALDQEVSHLTSTKNWIQQVGIHRVNLPARMARSVPLQSVTLSSTSLNEQAPVFDPSLTDLDIDEMYIYDRVGDRPS
ncbi:predicted protein [Aspergillus terreus NIH2624]|uniref:Uncharacterized protein n=1 Tax=Aspergillus terreus (strain NIH 2624 / FGSC A1156) TaxID=341663 RepID=Q0CCU8_ASPTN|nr:uncharacterized protein ATEG_08486 [Aspergillus terreus NIH2624]EAU31659.1 predicted protein [Aspergillus terreus NIH2624]